jgi:YNFM family putative membrane transporter
MWTSKFRHRPTPAVGGERASVVAPVVVLVICGLLVLMQLYVAIPLAPVVGQALGSDGAPAALGTAYSLAYALGLLVFGTLSDRYGRKAILVPGMAALAIATVVPALIALIGSRAGSNRGGALGLAGLVLFAGASCGPLAASLPLGFTSLLLALAALLVVGSTLVAISGRPR